MKSYDFLIVGSGLFEAIVAYLAHKAGKMFGDEQTPTPW